MSSCSESRYRTERTQCMAHGVDCPSIMCPCPRAQTDPKTPLAPGPWPSPGSVQNWFCCCCRTTAHARDGLAERPSRRPSTRGRAVLFTELLPEAVLLPGASEAACEPARPPSRHRPRSCCQRTRRAKSHAQCPTPSNPRRPTHRTAQALGPSSVAPPAGSPGRAHP